MPITPTQLRPNVYKILDRVIETGEPVEIERNGTLLKLVPKSPKNKLANLKPRKDILNGDPEDIIHIDWMKNWEPFI